MSRKDLVTVGILAATTGILERIAGAPMGLLILIGLGMAGILVALVMERMREKMKNR